MAYKMITELQTRFGAFVCMLQLFCTNCRCVLNSCHDRKFAEFPGFQDSVNFFETLQKEGVSGKVAFVLIGAYVHEKLKL